MSKEENQNKINIELKEDIAQGMYSNMVVITHSPSEFILDFVHIVPGMPKAQVKSRIIVTPDHAKRLMLTLQENIEKFERKHGTIKVNAPLQHKFPMNFGGPAGEA